MPGLVAKINLFLQSEKLAEVTWQTASGRLLTTTAAGIHLSLKIGHTLNYAENEGLILFKRMSYKKNHPPHSCHEMQN